MDILASIVDWIDIEDFKPYQHLPPAERFHAAGPTAEQSCIFWINGSAGTGKTTIAYTIAEDCRKHNILGASFFCSRDDAECKNPNVIFTTIAFHLGLFNPLFREEVRRIDPAIQSLYNICKCPVSAGAAYRETSSRSSCILPPVCRCSRRARRM
jgi:hypothetical protein